MQSDYLTARQDFAELIESNSSGAPAGSLLEMLASTLPEERVPERGIRPEVRARGRRPGAGYRQGEPPKRLFLAEFEMRGDVAAAALACGCTPWEIHRWRASDRMFARDFTLAAVAHVRMLKRMVDEVKLEHNSTSIRAEAQHLLQSESQFVGSDGRLDLRAWRDALKGFLDRIGLDPTDWEPKNRMRSADRDN